MQLPKENNYPRVSIGKIFAMNHGHKFVGLYFFIAAQITQVAQPVLFKYARQLEQSGQQ